MRTAIKESKRQDKKQTKQQQALTFIWLKK